jgi:hypothetical protein
MSASGVPAALLLIVGLAVFVGVMAVIDYAIIKAKGEKYSMTWGIRFLWVSQPFTMFMVVLLFGVLIGTLAMHFAFGHFSE